MGFRDFNRGQLQVLVVLMLINFVNYVDRQIIFSLFPDIRRDFGLSYVQAGLLVSAYSLSNSLFQFPFSFLADYTGRWRTVLALSHLVQSLPVLFYAYAGDYRLLLVLGFISGMGSAAYHPPAVSLITRELPARRGFTMGIFNGGGDVGHIVTPALVGWLTARVIGLSSPGQLVEEADARRLTLVAWSPLMPASAQEGSPASPAMRVASASCHTSS